MLAKFKNQLDTNFPYLKGKKLLLTVSGGVDSVVLVHLLKSLNFDIEIAHCNFKLRDKESDLDEQLVINLCTEFDLTFHQASFDTTEYVKTNKLSIQMAARELRYNWFEEIRTKNNLDFILTGHHQDDVLETFLINLTRGTGLEGLTGIPPKNGYIVRPMLGLTRLEILQYAEENNINWREDQSNASTKYVRNKLRHEVIPILKELNPSLMDSFKNTTQHLKDSQQIIEDGIAELRAKIVVKKDDYFELDIKKIQNLSNPKAYLYELLHEFGFSEWDDVLNLLTAQSGKQIFSKTHRLIKDREILLLIKIDPKTQPSSYIINEFLPEYSTPDISLNFSSIKKNESNKNIKNCVHINASLVEFPLTLRKWEHGDFFYPLGFSGKKKLSNFFKDEKMSLIEKERTWILCNANNDIIWVVGKRIDNRYRTTSKTKETIQISVYTTL